MPAVGEMDMVPGPDQIPRPRVVAVVLAAGSSTRMGRPKALLEFDGPVCLDLVLGACAEAALAGAVVVTAPDGEAVRARAAAAGLPALLAVNDQPERGMLSSLQAGLRHLPAGTDAFFIYPVDFPLSPARELARLVDAWAGRGPPAAARIFLPSFARRRGHPVLLDPALAPELLALGEGVSARDELAAHAAAIAHVDAADDRVLMDMDTPDDYRRCLARYRLDHGGGPR